MIRYCTGAYRPVRPDWLDSSSVRPGSGLVSVQFRSNNFVIKREGVFLNYGPGTIPYRTSRWPVWGLVLVRCSLIMSLNSLQVYQKKWLYFLPPFRGMLRIICPTPGPMLLEIILIMPTFGRLLASSLACCRAGWSMRGWTSRSWTNFPRYPCWIGAFISNWIQSSMLCPWSRWNWQYLSWMVDGAFIGQGLRMYFFSYISMRLCLGAWKGSVVDFVDWAPWRHCRCLGASFSSRDLLDPPKSRCFLVDFLALTFCQLVAPFLAWAYFCARVRSLE